MEIYMYQFIDMCIFIDIYIYIYIYIYLYIYICYVCNNAAGYCRHVVPNQG